MHPFTVGLTGGIASGKTLVADCFMEQGVPVLDGDTVAREIVEPGSSALREIQKTFGDEYLQADGQLDRRKMRERAFVHPADRKRLEGITHPRIRERLLQWRDAQTSPYCILSVPILIESGMDALVDRILVVDVSEKLQLQRLVERDRIPERLARQMLAAQAKRSARLARAHDVLRNNGSTQTLSESVNRLHAFYLQLAKSRDSAAPGLHLP